MLKQVTFIILFFVTALSAGDQTPELVVRQGIKLTLAGAQEVLKGAKLRAQALRIAENIAVVDDGGHLLAFERMDGARPSSVATAITKAVSAATMRRETGPLFDAQSAGAAMFNLAIEHAAAANGGTLTVLYGGVPIMLDGQVVGAIGVGGGSEEQDISVGRAGASALQAALPRDK
jgi:glc operon protein GlcG